MVRLLWRNARDMSDDVMTDDRSPVRQINFGAEEECSDNS